MSQKILVIEDEKIISSMLRDNLEMLGYEVITAESGAEGLRKAEIYQPDLITLDVMMPGLDGLTVLGRLKANRKVNGIPVILMSVTRDHEREGMKLGAVGFFRKPFDFKLLNSKIISLTTEKKVLLVDDNPDVLRALEFKLLSLGYTVECASNEKELMEKISSFKPDIILMDVVLEEKTGFELINKIKSLKESGNIPVISYSGYFNEDIPESKIVGAQKFADESFTAKELANEVREQLRKIKGSN